MKRGVIWIALTILMVTSLVLASCSTSTKTNTSITTSLSPTTTNTIMTSTTTAAIPTSTASTTATTSATTTPTGNWWDSLGTPKYGGTITLQISKNVLYFDPYQGEAQPQVYTAWLEQLFSPQWTMDPSVQNYRLSFWSNDQAGGQLVQSWEFTSPGTFVLHVRQGVYWQNIPPANGREFTADDIVYHYDRMLGLGDGFTQPAPYWGTVATYQALKSVTETDKFTVVMQWNTPNPEYVTENLEAPGASSSIEDSDAVNLWGNLNDWHHAIGTGPFLLTDFVDSSAATFNKNPTYWGYDQRHPQNQLPYIDKLEILIIPNSVTAMAAMRVGKIDIMEGISFLQAQQMKQSNPTILQIPTPQTGYSMDPRNDKAPYTDIRVREALQMAINLPELASTYYGGTADPWPCSLTSDYLTGWGFPYSQWPQDLKNQYAYNPTAAKQLLAQAGFPNGFTTDLVVDSAVDPDLVQIIQSYFAAIGVNMSINTMVSASFTSYVMTSHANDALSMRTQGTLGATGNPLRQFVKFQTGASGNNAMVNDPTFNNFYAQALAVTSTVQMQQLLQQCNQYVAQQHYVISLLQPNAFNLYWPRIKGYNAQYAVNSGGSGPQLLFFYEARFWIGQN